MAKSSLRIKMAIHFTDNALITFDPDTLKDYIDIISNEISEFGFEGDSLVYKYWWENVSKEIAVKYILANQLFWLFTDNELKTLSNLYKPADAPLSNVPDNEKDEREPRKPCPICEYETLYDFGDICPVCNWEDGAFTDEISLVNSLVDKTPATITSYKKEWLTTRREQRDEDSKLVMRLFDQIKQDSLGPSSFS